MDKYDIILCLASFGGIAGSFLGFFLVHNPEFKSRTINNFMLFIALLFWLAVPLSLLCIPILYIQCNRVLQLGYYSALVGSLLATFLMFLWNCKYILCPLIKRLNKEIKLSRETMRIL